MYIYAGRQDGSDVREPGRARGIRASADRERRQPRGRRHGETLSLVDQSSMQ
jgi:hypothetical protein